MNEAPEGEASLKLGEAAEMRNFCVTSGGALKKRPGSRNVVGLLTEYTAHVREGSERLLITDVGTDKEHQMWPRMKVDDVGEVQPDGDPVTVTAENAESYTGYYLKKDNATYAFTRRVTVPGAGTEDVTGGRATAGSRTVLASGSESNGSISGTRQIVTYPEAYIDDSGVGVRGDTTTRSYPTDTSTGWSTQDVGGYLMQGGQLYRYYGARVESSLKAHKWKKYNCTRNETVKTRFTAGPFRYYDSYQLESSEHVVYGWPGFTVDEDTGAYSVTGDQTRVGKLSPGVVYSTNHETRAVYRYTVASDGTVTIDKSNPMQLSETVISYSRGSSLGEITVPDGQRPDADNRYTYVDTFDYSGGTYTVMRSGSTYYCYIQSTGSGAAVTERTWSFYGYPLTVSRNGVEWYGNETYSQAPGGVEATVRGIWSGFVAGREVLCAACGGYLWELFRDDEGVWSKVAAGEIGTERDVHMFGFDEKLYLLNGEEYKVWDGERLGDVQGYRPLVAVSVEPSGGGTLLEGVNRLTAGRRCWFSPDGTSKTFQLPEKGIKSVDWVKDLTEPEAVALSDGAEVTGEWADVVIGPYSEPGEISQGPDAQASEEVSVEAKSQKSAVRADAHIGPNAEASVMALPTYSVDLEAGTVTFQSAPPKGVNTVEIAWSAGEDFKSQVTGMRFAELYNGAQDTRVFLYGDGSNKALYSGLDYNGKPRADYFPDLYEVAVGDANTPVTALIRHYNKLMAFKLDSAWSIGYDTITLMDGTVTAGFYVSPVNRSIGNCAYGQAQLVQNRPRTLDGRSVIEWKATSSSGNVTGDQRNAERVSQRVDSSIRKFDLSKARTFYDKISHEYFVIGEDGTAIVQNMDVDAWYVYTDLMATCMINYRDEVYYGTGDGYLRHFSWDYCSDNGAAIDAYWESGAISFAEDYRRKCSAMLWIGIKPEDNGYLEVTAQTDRKSDFAVYTVATTDAGAVPEMDRIKLKAKKFTYYKLILKNNTADKAATVVSADVRIRGTGFVR